MARELSVIVKELQDALGDVALKEKAMRDASDAHTKAATAHADAKKQATALRQEFDSLFDGLVPDGRVRSSN